MLTMGREGFRVFGKFLNNYYYGKSGKGDYRKGDLPKNRWQQFWEMLRDLHIDPDDARRETKGRRGHVD